MLRPRLAAPLALIALLLTAPAASADTQTLSFFSRAITVEPYVGEQKYMPLVPNGVDAPDRPGYITHLEADVVRTRDPNAAPLDIQDVMIHHLVYNAGGAVTQSPSCGGRFFARGEEGQVFDLPAGYGLPNWQGGLPGPLGSAPVPAGSSAPGWILTHMLMNHRSFAQTVYVRLKVTYSDDPLAPVLPYWIDTDGCDVDPTFDVPGGKGRGSTYNDRHPYRVPQGAGGRIITSGGHLHGGGMFLDLRSKTCDRTLVNSRAYYGQPDHAFYKVRPKLHEPSPIRMGIHNSAEGVPISSGEDLELVAGYDNEIPHTRVMSIMALYVAQEDVPQCAPMPGDVQETNRPADFREPYPRFKVPLIRKPDDPFRKASRGNNVGTFFFRPDRITARRGQKVTWTFRGGILHTVGVANGPRGFSSPWMGNGTFSYTPRKRGTYRLFCALHPAAMTQELKVK